MFQVPSRTSSTFVAPPPGAIDTDTRYIFKLVKLEDKGVSPFADPAKNETYHSIEWTFQIAHADSKAMVYNTDGQPWEYVEQATSKIGKNPKNGMIAKSRLFIEALLGHPVTDDEITADLPNQLLNRYATGFFEYVQREAQDGSSYQKLQIMRLSPYKPGAPAEPKPAPAPAPAPSPPTSTTADPALPF